MNSEELFIAIQNLDKLPPSRLPEEVVEWMVRCWKEGWYVEYINNPSVDSKWLDVKGRIGDPLLERMMEKQKFSCFRIVVWTLPA